MCGIAGFIGFKKDGLIKQMSADLAHRGPDGDGFYINDTVSLMNRRLAIIDRAGGDQPIYNEDKTIAVVYNGEIYNYQELRKQLETAGHIFSTHSDTEVIVHGYEQWGETCFDRFNGMFAVALYDLKNKKLVLARDHFGIKPLYFAQANNSEGQLIFASEIKPLLNSKLFSTKPNERILFRYLKYRIHDDQEETFFENIYRLMPGQVMTIQDGKIEKKQFTHLKDNLIALSEYNRKGGNLQDDIDSFKAKFIQSVKMRLISEVPVGTCLSGGLDSSSVVAIVNKLLQEKVKEAASVGAKQNTFSAVFPGSTNDEGKYISSLLDTLESVESHKVQPKPETFFEDLEDFIRTQEEPTISTGPYAQYKVMQVAHKYVTVLLDGQGADEMMAGYLPYYFVYLNQLKNEKKYGPLLLEVWNSKDVLTKYFFLKLWRSTGFNKDVESDTILNSNFSSKFSNERFGTIGTNIKKRLIEDIFSNSLQSLLRYEDKNSMRFSIEGRVPFLDFELMKFLFSLPDEVIIKNGWNKYILRQSMKEFLPDMISQRRNKIGFTTPEHEWFMRMKNRIYSIFLSESFANRPYFNQPNVLKAFQEFIEGKNDDTLVFWRMLNVELWLREFFDKKKQEVKKEREFFEPNEQKTIEIKVENTVYNRYPIKTELFKKDDIVAEKVSSYVSNFITKFKGNSELHSLSNKKWFVVISEKVVAISQGRSYFIWDIKPSMWATTLSKFVKKTPYGIGLGSPWTMQIAIDEVGLPKILLATIVSAVTKPFGLKGMFYHIAGREVAAIDGPTEYSLYPSNVSAKLGPKDPQKVAKHIDKVIRERVHHPHFEGVVIIDANDIGRNVLGNSTKIENKVVEEIFRDNPMGQSSEQTPLITVLF